MKNYSIKYFDLKQDVSLWDSFVEKSPDGTIFATSAFLKNTPQKLVTLGLYKGEHLKALSYFFTNEEETKVMGSPFSIHCGLIIAWDLVDSIHTSKTISARFEITEFWVQEVLSKYQTINLNLAPSLIDVRPFAWFNYGEADKKQFIFNVRYTNYLNLEDYQNMHEVDGDYFQAIGMSRRQEIRKALKNNFEIELSKNYQAFLDQYAAFSSKYDENANATAATYKKILAEVNSENMLVVMPKNGTTSGALFLIDNKRAYYLLGFTLNTATDYEGSYVLWCSMAELKKKGVKIVDFEGVNSPKRGWFKTSFGGDLVNYYNVRLS